MNPRIVTLVFSNDVPVIAQRAGVLRREDQEVEHHQPPHHYANAEQDHDDGQWDDRLVVALPGSGGRWEGGKVSAMVV